MSRFKPGDRVRCNWQDTGLKHGNVYTVAESMGDGLLKLKGKLNRTYHEGFIGVEGQGYGSPYAVSRFQPEDAPWDVTLNRGVVTDTSFEDGVLKVTKEPVPAIDTERLDRIAESVLIAMIRRGDHVMRWRGACEDAYEIAKLMLQAREEALK